MKWSEALLVLSFYQLMHIGYTDETCLSGGRSKMKRSIAVFALVTFLVAFIGVGLAIAKKGTPPLTCEIEYFLTGHLGILDSEGRLFCWAGPISGDIEGIMKWWAVLPPSSTGQVSHLLIISR